MSRRLLLIPTGGGGSGADLTNYYTKSEVDGLIADFVTESTNSLINYYLKTETYSQAEINSLISAIETTHFEVFASISDITDPQGNLIYLIGPSGTGADQYEEYVYANNQWTKIGDTSVDLTGYATTADLQNAINTAMNTLQNALGNYYNKSEVDEMIAQVQTLQGIQGIKGADGVDGSQGIQGIQGADGVNGVDGLQGIQGIQGPAGGGADGGNAWYGTQAQFDALESKDLNTDYFISDQITWDEIADKPNVPTKISELPNDKGYVSDKEMKNYINERKIMHIVNSHNWYGTQAEYDALETLDPDTNYHIEGDEVSLQMTFTFTDSTQAVYDVFVRPTV